MCKHGDDVMLEVPMNPDGTGLKVVGVDRCIAPIVDALNARGIYTKACCCGHGSDRGSVVLHDGRTLTIGRTKQGETLYAEEDFFPAALSRRARIVLANHRIDSKEKLLALDVAKETLRWPNCGSALREQLRTAQKAIRDSSDDAERCSVESDVSANRGSEEK